MSHFNPKSLAFYGGAIGFVVILFSVTTSYGEANLKAPRELDGRYRLSGTSLPGCLKTNQAVLTLSQSGVYLNGSLLPAEASEKVTKAVDQRPPLSGEWNDRHFSLTGPISHWQGCDGTVSLQGTLEQTGINGTLQLSSEPGSVDFTAQKEPPPAKSSTAH